MNNDPSRFEVALTKCFYCGEDNEIIMNKTLTPFYAAKIKELHGKVVDMEPCPKCKEYMEQGIILISIRDGETGNNPYRTGGFVVIKENAMQKIMPPDLFNDVKKRRFAFVENKVWNHLGLPKPKID